MAAFDPTGVVTTTLTVPAVPAGVTHVIVVVLTTATLVAAAPPKVTPVAPRKLVPVRVTDVPPAAAPLLALTEASVGGESINEQAHAAYGAGKAPDQNGVYEIPAIALVKR